MSRDTTEILGDALGHFDRMRAHASHDLGDQLVIDAVCMRLSAGIETLATVDPAVRADLFGDDWRLGSYGWHKGVGGAHVGNLGSLCGLGVTSSLGCFGFCTLFS